MISLTLLMGCIAQAADFSCKIRTGDVGAVVGHGSKPDDALSDARFKCGERRADAFKAIRHADVDEERMSDFIDSCINLSCDR